MAVLALGTVWTVFALVLGPHVIRSAYRGESFAFFNHMIAGQATHPLDEYLARWKVLTWSMLGVLLSSGAFVVVATRPWPRWLVRLGLPIVAFLLARSLLWVGFAAAPTVTDFGHRHDGGPARFATSFALGSWARWDSIVYLGIAQRGYEFHPCDIPFDGVPIARVGSLREIVRDKAGKFTGYLPFSSLRGEEWCGNTAWFPGYPALIRLLALFRIPEFAGGVFLSATFCVLTLFLVWTEFLGAERKVKNLLCLLFASQFPGAVYYHAIFPISMLTFFMLLSMKFTLRKQWIYSGLAGAAAAFTYPTGAFVAVASAGWVFHWFRNVRFCDKLRWTTTFASITAAGVALVIIVQRLFIGIWDAFSRMQSAYPRSGMHMPISTLLFNAKYLVSNDGWEHPSISAFLANGTIMAAGTLFLALVVVLLLGFSARATRSSPIDAYLLIFLVASWLFVLLVAHESLVRKQAFLLPAVPLARNLPAWLLAAIVVFAMLLVPLIAIVFYNGTLV